MRIKKYNSKRCARCGTKNNYDDYRCSECGLVFSRVEHGSNILAKEYIHAKKYDYIVYAPMFPKDVSKKKFLFLSGFLGFFGAHNFYVGRFKKALFQLIFGLISVIMVACTSIIPYYDEIMSFLFLPIGISGFMWLFDFVDGLFNKYKIPVAVDFLEGDGKKNG